MMRRRKRRDGRNCVGRPILIIVALQVLLAGGLCCQADVPRIVYDAAATDETGQQLPDGVHQATFRVYAEPVAALLKKYGLTARRIRCLL